jgi:ribosomal protein L34E
MSTRTRPAGATRRTERKAHATQPGCQECGAALSSYNPGPNCYAHTLDIPWKGPGVRLR